MNRRNDAGARRWGGLLCSEPWNRSRELEVAPVPVAPSCRCGPSRLPCLPPREAQL